ncbi:contactin-3-like [Misgurnus anguillicaudatus]|uniref:contactin-3-like n=1 Tax=Misgurnus anguillicaudatus TaxID=75329 RepID=UPI003CCF22CA
MDRVIFFCFVLLLDGAFGADVSVSVMKRDDVTLPVKSDEIKGASKLEWKFNDNIIASSNVQLNIQTEAQYPDGRFKDRLYLQSWTGSLQINRIQTEDTGLYKLEIKSSGGSKYKTFNVTVSDKVESVSALEGETVRLETRSSPHSDDVTEWRFEGSLIFKEERMLDPHPDYYHDERFRDRLDMHSSGSLIIKKFKSEDSGFYDVNIKSKYGILHKRFSLTVTGSSPRSHQVKIGPGLFVVVIMLVIVLVY